MATTVMIVDDDDAVRKATRRILEAEGYEVTEAPDGQTALRHFMGHPTDLVITDIYMPEMDGIQFMMRLREAVPEVRILAMSGGGFQSKENVLGAATMLGAVTTLEKPFEMADFLEAVETALNSPNPS